MASDPVLLVSIGIFLFVLGLALFSVIRERIRRRQPMEPSIRIGEPPTPWSPGGAGSEAHDPRPRARRVDHPPLASPKPDPPPTPEELDKPAAERLLRHRSPWERERAAHRLANIGDPDSTPALLDALAASRVAGRDSESEIEAQIDIVNALGDVGDERCLSAIFDCVPLYSSFRDGGAPSLERAGGACLRVLRRSPRAGREWLARARKEQRPGTEVTLALAAAMLGDPDAVDAVASALKTNIDDWERASLVASAAELDDPAAVSVILGQVSRGCNAGGRELEKSLCDIVERLLPRLPTDLLRGVAQVLPFRSSPLAAGPFGKWPVFLDGPRRAALDELERRDEHLTGFAVARDGESPETEGLGRYRQLLSRLTVASEEEKPYRVDGAGYLYAKAEELEAEMRSLLELEGDTIPARALVPVLRLPVERKLVSCVVDVLRRRSG